MRAWSLWSLCAILCAGLLTSWIPARWPASIVEVGACAIALAWVVRLVSRGERPVTGALLAVPALFTLWGAAQLALGFTVSASETEHATLAWAANLALVFAALQTFGPAERRRFEALLLAFGFALAVVSTLQLYTSGGRVFWLFPVADPQFLMGPFVNHNHYAAFVELLLPVVLLSTERRTARLLMAAVLIATVIASASRSGVTLVVVEAAVLLWATSRGNRLALAGGAAAAILFAAVVGWQPLWERVKLGEPNSARANMLRSSIAMIHDHWVRGVGLGNWPVMYPAYALYDDGLFANQAHNDWAQWIAEGGLPSAAAALLLLVWTARRARRDLLAAGPLFVMIHALVDYPFEKPEIAALLFVILAASAVDNCAGSKSAATL